MTAAQGLWNRLFETAQQLGFGAMGAVGAQADPRRPVLEHWLAEGMHGDMAWMAKDPARRTDPRQVLPEARSVIALFHPYHPGPLEGPLTDVPRGRFARYALGDDYHDVTASKLRALAAELEDPTARVYTDTGPFLERSVASRAQIGWTGKSGLLIHPKLGTYGFLAEIVTVRELPVAETPHPDRCGTCTRCLDVCPTGALVAPGLVDSRRCISYLTIEHRGPIPHALRPLIGDWVYGCDLCQEVCPWNRKAPASQEPAFQPKPERIFPRLTDLLLMTQEQFSQTFKGSAIKRTKRRGLARNAAIALGNAKDPATVPALKQALEADAEPLVRGAVAWALGQIGTLEARQALEAAQKRESDPEVADEIRLALAEASR
ncbi:Epoxyqueuosine reductase [compost metagenome]